MTRLNNSATRQEVFFVTGNLPDLATLLSGLPVDAEVHVLDATQDGLTQMASLLSERSGLNAIHILSHGSSGALQLGSSTLNEATLTSRASDLALIGQSLSAEGDILLYGCNVAAGDVGAQFVGKLAQVTQADVAASSDLTGAEGLGGDWILEKVVGPVETKALHYSNFNALLSAPSIGLTTFDGLGFSNTNGTLTASVSDIGASGWNFSVAIAAGDPSISTTSDLIRARGLFGVSINTATLASNDGSEFNLTSLKLAQFSNTTAGTYSLSLAGYRDGNLVTTVQSFSITSSAGTILTPVSPSSFLSVDEIRITRTSAGDPVEFIYVDDILISAAKSLAYSATTFTEAAANNGAITATSTITLTNDSFTGNVGDPLGTVTNVPGGLTASLVKASATTATFSFTGNATNHANAQDIANLTVTFANGDFTGGSAAGVMGATTNNLAIDFADPAVGKYIQGDGSGGGGGGSVSGTGGAGGAGGGDFDTLTGTAYNDILFGDGSGGGGGGRGDTSAGAGGSGGAGGGGNDSLQGGSGNDVLFGDGFNGANTDIAGGAGGLGGAGGGAAGYSATSPDGRGGLGAGGGSSFASRPTALVVGFGNPGGGDSAAGGSSATSLGSDTGTGGSSPWAEGGGGGFGGAAGGNGAANGGLPGIAGDAGNNYTHEYFDTTGSIRSYFSDANLRAVLTSYPTFGAGADTLDGGAGSDELFGLGGADTFVFDVNVAGAADTDRVWDLTAADKVELKNSTTIDDAAKKALLTAATLVDSDGDGAVDDLRLALTDTGKAVNVDLINTAGVKISGNYLVVGPSITSATYDAGTGTLVVTGTNLDAFAGLTNDITANAFSITGQGIASYALTNTANVEITSATAFTLTLSSTDKTAVNALLNKNGISSLDGTTFNIAATTNNWNANVFSSRDITGNGITVSLPKSLAYSATTFTEAVANDGSITATSTITLSNDTFTGATGAALGAVSNVPAGLTAVLVKASVTTATLSFTGNATLHANAQDIANLTVTFGNADFTGGSAVAVTGATTSNLVIDFADPAVGKYIQGDGSGGGGGGAGGAFAGGNGGAGGGGADALSGTAYNDVLLGDGSGGGAGGRGVGGNNTATTAGAGGGGDDSLQGGGGNDILFGDGFSGATGDFSGSRGGLGGAGGGEWI